MADTDQVLNLAAIIREVDGSNNKGAAALAESILDHPRFRAALADEPAVPEGREPATWTEGVCGDGAALLKDGVMVPIEAVVRELNEGAHARAVFARWGTSNLTQTWRSPADGAMEGLTRDDVLRWLQQDQAWGVLVAPTEWRPVDDEWLNLIHRAVLARWGNPAPQPPAEGEVEELVAEIRHFLAGYRKIRGLDPEYVYSIHRGDAMEAHIRVSRLSHAAELLQRLSPPQPVPVSERLPGPEDCDAAGRCWWHRYTPTPEWHLRFGRTGQHNHWLPAHALPLPGQEVEG